MLALYNIHVKYNVKLRSLPIGGLICLSSSTTFSDKIVALKQDNTTLVVISDRVFCRSVSYVALECAHYLHFENRYLPLHVSTEAPTLSTSILLDYTSYSQTE